MKQFSIKKILMPTDFSETAGNALKQAIIIAKTAKAELSLLHIISPQMNYQASVPVPYSEPYYDDTKNSIAKKLKEAALQIKKEHGITVSYEIKFGKEYKEICDTAEKENFDLIVMGTHGVSGVVEFFVGSNASKVVTHAACPVITVQKAPKTKSIKKILMPIRAEMNSRQKVDYVIELSKLFSSVIFITGFANKGNKPELNTVKQYVKQVEKYLTGQKINYHSTVISADNFTKEILLQAKKDKADMIAIMNEFDFSLDQLVKGSFAKQIVNHSSIPVMAVPSISSGDDSSGNFLTSGDVPY